MVPVSSVILTEDQTLSYGTDLLAAIILVGAGGSGGSVTMSSTTKRKSYATGGNGGAVAIQLMRLSANTDYAFTIGSGGAGVGTSSPSGSVARQGNQGEPTSLDIGDTGTEDIIAAGGAGGSADTQPLSFTDLWFFVGPQVYSPSGYSGEGADLIIPSGPGGLITSQNSDVTYSRALATGGGAANILGAPASMVIAGNAWVQAGNSGDAVIATGGAGVAGSGGDGTNSSTAGSPVIISTGGGGTAGKAPGTTSSSSGSSNGGQGVPFNLNTLLAPNGAGGNASGDSVASTPSPADAGGGGFGVGSENDTNFENWRAQPGGIFSGGGGAASNTRTSGWRTHGGDGGLGGGGGGAVSNPGDDGGFSGDGGGGVAFIFLFSDFGKVRA